MEKSMQSQPAQKPGQPQAAQKPGQSPSKPGTKKGGKK